MVLGLRTSTAGLGSLSPHSLPTHRPEQTDPLRDLTSTSLPTGLTSFALTTSTCAITISCAIMSDGPRNPRPLTERDTTRLSLLEAERFPESVGRHLADAFSALDGGRPDRHPEELLEAMRDWDTDQQELADLRARPLDEQDYCRMVPPRQIVTPIFNQQPLSLYDQAAGQWARELSEGRYVNALKVARANFEVKAPACCGPERARLLEAVEAGIRRDQEKVRKSGPDPQAYTAYTGRREQ